jgi:hypothetical protein
MEQAGLSAAFDQGEDRALAGWADIAALCGRREVLVAGRAGRRTRTVLPSTLAIRRMIGVSTRCPALRGVRMRLIGSSSPGGGGGRWILARWAAIALAVCAAVMGDFTGGLGRSRVNFSSLLQGLANHSGGGRHPGSGSNQKSLG